MADPDRFSIIDLIRLSGRAIGRINTHGRNGTSMITHEEIEAMATTLLILGFPPITTKTGAEELATVLPDLLPRLTQPSGAFVATAPTPEGDTT